MSKTNRSVAPHYLWAEICEGWRLLDSEDLSVIEELMPSQTKETRHVHKRANQLFYMLAGTLTIVLDGQIQELTPSDALNVQPGQTHQARNDHQTEPARFLVSPHNQKRPTADRGCGLNQNRPLQRSKTNKRQSTTDSNARLYPSQNRQRAMSLP